MKARSFFISNEKLTTLSNDLAFIMFEIEWAVHSVHPDISQLYSIGKSVEGKDLLVLELSNKFNVGTIKPNVRLIAADEPVAKEMMLNLIFHLVQNYRTDNVIRLSLFLSFIFLSSQLFVCSFCFWL